MNNRSKHLDKWESDFDKTERRALTAIIAIWVLFALFYLTLFGVLIWGVIELVQWLTTK